MDDRTRHALTRAASQRGLRILMLSIDRYLLVEHGHDPVPEAPGLTLAELANELDVDLPPERV